MKPGNLCKIRCQFLLDECFVISGMASALRGFSFDTDVHERIFKMSEIKKMLFTSESVTEGHPDKICDKISDAILDEILRQDPMSRVACETFATTGIVNVMGEITTNATIDIQKIVRETVSEIGYTRAKYGFDASTCAVLSSIHAQSPDVPVLVGGAFLFFFACLVQLHQFFR